MTVDLNVIIDTLWVVIASVLVFSMQAGFALVLLMCKITSN